MCNSFATCFQFVKQLGDDLKFVQPNLHNGPTHKGLKKCKCEAKFELFVNDFWIRMVCVKAHYGDPLWGIF
jgi:uncharacterized protein (DUF2237 family)